MRYTALRGLTYIAAAGLLSIPAAFAQPQTAAVQGATPPPPAAEASPMVGQPVPGKTAEQRVQNHIKELHRQLQITQAEEPQWNEFAQTMRENARDMDQVFMKRAEQFPSMNAVQNMQSYEQISQEHARLVEKLLPAFQKLYDAMPEQQKRVADQVFRANAEKHMERAAQSHRG